MVKCHSKRLDSRGAACSVGSGWEESSEASLSIRLMVGDFVLKVGSAMTIALGRGGGNDDLKTASDLPEVEMCESEVRDSRRSYLTFSSLINVALNPTQLIGWRFAIRDWG